ncbi:MAG: efflux RND transporter permease subunit, partial [Gemmataceae bacterium]
MISHFFINRPIFASVLSIVLVIAGIVSMLSLPITLYPPIAPPTIQVSVSYPGASAEVVADTVAAPIEQQVNGVDDMIYMSSTCDNTGYYNLTVTFSVGTDLDLALVNVQNRVNLAVPQLPNAVRKQGLTIKKKTPDILLAINFYSPDGRYNDLYLSNYATIHVKDEIFRLEGVADITYLGQRDYSIRAWLDPEKMAARNISTNEVINAIKMQNYPVSPGQIGQKPSSDGQMFQQPIDIVGRLRTPEQFGDIIVRTIPGGAKPPRESDPNPSPAAALV